jgi:hypothetical protein
MPGTVREPRRKEKSAVGSRYQATVTEDCNKFRSPIVICEVCKTVRSKSLLAVTSCERSVNPIASSLQYYNSLGHIDLCVRLGHPCGN